MSFENNSSFIKQMQNLLKEYGHSVKTGHLYEICSKLSDEKSWNSAKAKKVSFQDSMPYLKDENLKNKKHYIEMLWLKELRRIGRSELLSGYSLDKKIIIKKDFTKSPHSLFVGAMGTGKTRAQIAGIISFLKQESSLVYICDGLTGAMDYKPFFSKKQVIPVLSKFHIEETISLVHAELKRRKDLFDQEGVTSIDAWKENHEVSLGRILICFENFDHVCNTILTQDQDKLNLIGEKLKDILRTGRSYGVWVSACSQRALINSYLSVSFTNRYAFKGSSADSECVVAGSSEILKNLSADDKGLCVGDEGMIQFPSFSDDKVLELIKHLK